MQTQTAQPLYIRMHAEDNVAIVANDGGLPAGSRFACGLILTEPVPQGHKLALVDLAEGAPVVRYSVAIGYAKQPIAAGSWVHEACCKCPRRARSSISRSPR
jgi:galactarate dehydratase